MGVCSPVSLCTEVRELPETLALAIDDWRRFIWMLYRRAEGRRTTVNTSKVTKKNMLWIHYEVFDATGVKESRSPCHICSILQLCTTPIPSHLARDRAPVPNRGLWSYIPSRQIHMDYDLSNISNYIADSRCFELSLIDCRLDAW